MHGVANIAQPVANRSQSKFTASFGSLASLTRDPRHYQIAVLALLLIYGVGWLNFDVSVEQITILLGTVVLTQFIGARFPGQAAFDPRSPLISGLSLCLLLRTNNPLLLVTAAVVAVASKFVIRWHGKHIFNPTNFAIVVSYDARATPTPLTPDDPDTLPSFLARPARSCSTSRRRRQSSVRCRATVVVPPRDSGCPPGTTVGGGVRRVATSSNVSKAQRLTPRHRSGTSWSLDRQAGSSSCTPQCTKTQSP